METLLINEQFVSQFKYWSSGQVRTGMRFRSSLFEYVSQFKPHQRPQAFERAWELTQTGREAIVTASATQYTVWVNLRGSDRSILLGRSSSAQVEPFSRPIQAGLRLETPLSA